MLSAVTRSRIEMVRDGGESMLSEASWFWFAVETSNVRCSRMYRGRVDQHGQLLWRHAAQGRARFCRAHSTTGGATSAATDKIGLWGFHLGFMKVGDTARGSATA